MAKDTKMQDTRATDFIPSDVDEVVMLGNPMLDNLVTSMTAMGAEMWAMWRRMRVLEKVLEDKGVTEAMIEAYAPAPELDAAWQKERDAFIVRTLGPLTRQGSLPVSAERTKKS